MGWVCRCACAVAFAPLAGRVCAWVCACSCTCSSGRVAVAPLAGVAVARRGAWVLCARVYVVFCFVGLLLRRGRGVAGCAGALCVLCVCLSVAGTCVGVVVCVVALCFQCERVCDVVCAHCSIFAAAGCIIICVLRGVDPSRGDFFFFLFLRCVFSLRSRLCGGILSWAGRPRWLVVAACVGQLFPRGLRKKGKTGGVVHHLLTRDCCIAFWRCVPALFAVSSFACSVTSLSRFPDD